MSIGPCSQICARSTARALRPADGAVQDESTVADDGVQRDASIGEAGSRKGAKTSERWQRSRGDAGEEGDIRASWKRPRDSLSGEVAIGGLGA